MGDGVQPVIGCLLAVARPGSGEAGKPHVIDWLALYAQDEKGYDNLCGLVSSAHLDRPVHEATHVALHALAGRTDGLIALTAGREGAVTQLLADGQATAATGYLDQLQQIFPNRLYIEIRSEEHTSELQSLMRNPYAVFC